MSKKIYASPTITDHGNAVEQTQGFYGRCWEIAGHCYEVRDNIIGSYHVADEDR